MDALLDALVPAPGASDLAARRHAHAESWLRAAIAHRFGEEGVRAAGPALALPRGAAPFKAARDIAARLRVTFAPLAG